MNKFFLLLYLFVNEFNRPSMAAPFNLNCAAMQNYANVRFRDNPKETTFLNFNAIRMNVSEYSLSCSGGFVRESSPLGVRVCEISLNYTLDGKLTWQSVSSGGTACRWL